MSRISLAILFLCLPVLVLAQTSASAQQYHPAFITQVKPHQVEGTSAPGEALYEVSIKVNGTTYVVLTKSPSGESTILYAIGRELLVRVGDNTIMWNDILGQSHEVPIMSRGPIADTSKSQTD